MMNTDTTQRITRIRVTCQRVLELGEKATAEWWPQHPMGGNKIYPDANTHDWLATFMSSNDCELALASRTLTPALARAMLTLLDALENNIVGFDNDCISVFCKRLLASVVAEWPEAL